MNKYEKTLGMIGKVLGFSLFALMSLALTISPIIVVIFVGVDMLGAMLLLFEFCLFLSVHVISYAVGLFFLGDHYEPTGYVSEGRSLNWPVETYIYIKRNMITNLIELIVCAVFGVAYIVLICLNVFTTLAICGFAISLIAFWIFFLFYKKQQYKIKTHTKQ